MASESQGGTDVASTKTLDRRAALRKAATAGAIAWVAPTVLSSEASATTACTPKCAPVGGGSFTGTLLRTSCGPQGPLNEPHPNGFQIVNASAAGAGCGCGGAPTIILSGGGQTFSMPNDAWTHQYCPEDGVHIGWVGRHPNRPPAAPDAPVYATLVCRDRRGRQLCRTCEIWGRFEYCHRRNPTCATIPTSFTVTWTVGPCQGITCC